MAWGDLEILTCMEVRNVTVIPHIVLDAYSKGFDPYLDYFFQDMVMQLRYLVKSMLEIPCFIVWAFSPLQSRSIRLSKENYVQYFESGFQAITRTDANEVMKVLVNIPHNKDDNKQTLFFFTFNFAYKARPI